MSGLNWIALLDAALDQPHPTPALKRTINELMQSGMVRLQVEKVEKVRKLNAAERFLNSLNVIQEEDDDDDDARSDRDF